MESSERESDSPVRRFIELFAASGLVVAMPLLDVFGRAPEQFAYRGATSKDIILFGVLVVLGPPLLLWIVESLVRLASARIGELAHVIALEGLAMVGAVQVLQDAGPPVLVVAACVALGIGFAVLYWRSRGVRLWLRYLAIAPVFALISFVTMSDTARLLDSTNTYAVEPGDPSPVVMLVLDELPLVTLLEGDGTIDEALFPHLAALADDSHWFRKTTSMASTTMYAVPAMLTGVIPTEDATAIAADYPDNLFTLLGGSYDLDVTESVTRLCPESLCEPTVDTGGLRSLLTDAREVLGARIRPERQDVDLTAGFDEDHAEDEDETEGDRLYADSAADHPLRFTRMVENLDTDQTALHYAHLLLPHVPWRYLADGTGYDEFETGYGKYLGAWTRPEITAVQHQRHLQQAMYADTLVGELVQSLRDEGIYDDATVVLVADHGISFTSGQTARGTAGRPADLDVASQLMLVPFFVKEPGQTAGEVHDGNVWGVDVLPTIAEVLDLDIPWEIDGVSALSDEREGDATHFYINTFNPDGTKLGLLQEPDLVDLWSEALDHTIDHAFPAGDDPADPLRPWRVGPRPELVGLDEQDLPSGSEAVEARFDPSLELDLAGGAADPDVPVLVHGTIDGLAEGTPLAVVVNGTVTSTMAVMKDQTFFALVDASRYRDGANEVAIVRLPPR